MWALAAGVARIHPGRSLLRHLMQLSPRRVRVPDLDVTHSPAPHVRRLPEIVSAFLTGYNAMIACDHLRMVPDRLSHLPPFLRGFAFEGTGMGFGARTLLGLSHPTEFGAMMESVGTGHLYQYFVGLGWWLELRYGLDTRRWAPWLAQLPALYSPICFDGAGFRLGIFRPTERPDRHPAYADLSAEGRAGLYQGYGRAHWFRSHGQIERLQQTAATVPELYREEFLSGVALAAAYSRLDDPTIALQLPAAFDKRDRLALWQGIAFGWEARQLQDEGLFAALLAPHPKALRIAPLLRDAVHTARTEASRMALPYSTWLRATRNRLANEERIQTLLPEEEGRPCTTVAAGSSHS